MAHGYFKDTIYRSEVSDATTSSEGIYFHVEFIRRLTEKMGIHQDFGALKEIIVNTYTDGGAKGAQVFARRKGKGNPSAIRISANSYSGSSQQGTTYYNNLLSTMLNNVSYGTETIEGVNYYSYIECESNWIKTDDFFMIYKPIQSGTLASGQIYSGLFGIILNNDEHTTITVSLNTDRTNFGRVSVFTANSSNAYTLDNLQLIFKNPLLFDGGTTSDDTSTDITPARSKYTNIFKNQGDGVVAIPAYISPFVTDSQSEWNGHLYILCISTYSIGLPFNAGNNRIACGHKLTIAGKKFITLSPVTNKTAGDSASSVRSSQTKYVLAYQYE